MESGSEAVSTDNNNSDQGFKKCPSGSVARTTIQIMLVYERPRGTSLHTPCSVDPGLTVHELKQEICDILSLPVENAVMYHHNRKMEDERTLGQHGLASGHSILVHDGRLVYNHRPGLH